ncbi:MAG TPA: NAD-dependent epimerase/dehydratase family protein [Gemmataceae bacterium]|jgi:UDP-glucose 4-epimerase|nr:NAD-dependent epimerase/dehydratase family protein [Gemmataceae bacterium]
MSDLCLVTGGAGFIGSHLVDSLVRDGRPVRVLDDLSTGHRENVADHGKRIDLVEGSITDPTAVAKAVRGVETIFHLGALASVARSVETPLASHAVCATGTVTLLDGARHAGVRRVVYAASSSAYGGYSTQEGQTEDLLPNALSPYAAAKLAGEYYMQAFAATYGIETVRLRFFNIFGPRQRADSPYSGVIALFIAAMEKGQIPIVHGDGLQSRDFTYVANCVQAIRKAGDAPRVSARVFNVGTGSSVTVLDLVNVLNKLMGKAIQAKHADPRAGDVRYSQADITRTRRDLGYEPTVSFEDGLAKTLAWYRGEKWT